MRPRDQQAATKLESALIDFDGMSSPSRASVKTAADSPLVEQLIESIRRIQYVVAIQTREISASCADPRTNASIR